MITLSVLCYGIAALMILAWPVSRDECDKTIFEEGVVSQNENRYWQAAYQTMMHSRRRRRRNTGREFLSGGGYCGHNQGSDKEYVHVTFDHVGEEAARGLARQCGKKPKTIDQWMQSFRKGLADHNNY